jgi:hypothetical protein
MMLPSAGVICSIRFAGCADCAQALPPPAISRPPAVPAMAKMSRREIALRMLIPPRCSMDSSADCEFSTVCCERL